MARLFEKSLSAVTLDDVNELIALGWPESYGVEYKRSLPDKRGGTAAWDRGIDEVGEYARDEVLAEIVAMANADGGIVILGIDETSDKPPRAATIVTTRDIGKLAQRLEDQARACIDPPLSMLQIHAIEVENGSGVLVIKTPASRLAPHRLNSTKEAFARRGPSTIRMNMREIQEMSLAVTRRNADLTELFEQQRAGFQRWRSNGEPIAFRVTAIPLDPLPPSGRLFDPTRPTPFFRIREYLANVGQKELRLVPLFGTLSERPILRGIAGETTAARGRARIELTQSGIVRLWFGRSADQVPGAKQDRARLYHGWVLGGVANVLQLIDEHRHRVGFPDAEYGVELEIVRTPSSPDMVPGYIGLGDNSFDANTFDLNSEQIQLPVVPVVGPDSFDTVINTMTDDIFDALGARFGTRDPIVVMWP